MKIKGPLYSHFLLAVVLLCSDCKNSSQNKVMQGVREIAADSTQVTSLPEGTDLINKHGFKPSTFEEVDSMMLSDTQFIKRFFGKLLEDADSSFFDPEQLKWSNKTFTDSLGKVYPDSIAFDLIFSRGTVPKTRSVGKNIVVIYPYSETFETLPKREIPIPSLFFENGEVLEDFVTTDISGNTIDSRSLRGRIVVINFWFVNCLPCRREMPDLNHLVETYRSNNHIVFIAISPDSKESVRKFLEKKAFNYTQLPDSRKIIKGYGIDAYPTHVVIGKDGKVLFHCTDNGEHVIQYLKKIINKHS